MQSRRGPGQRRPTAVVAILCGILFGSGAATATEPGAPPGQETTNPASPTGEARAAGGGAVEAGVSPIRRLDIDAATGAEPDPESFDRIGLERWWASHVRRERPDPTPPVHAAAAGAR